MRALESGAADTGPFPEAHTAAFGSTVPKALSDFLGFDAVRSGSGTATCMSEEELLA